MASKVARVRKKEVVKVVHGALLKTNIKATIMASAAPRWVRQAWSAVLGPERVPLPTRISIKPDRTYDLGDLYTNNLMAVNSAGMISVKHVYEIAKGQVEGQSFTRSTSGVQLRLRAGVSAVVRKDGKACTTKPVFLPFLKETVTYTLQEAQP
ncbi:hypothetical protein COOONC_17758 [Cooperia oncophora]